jgi:hypothetical protein
MGSKPKVRGHPSTARKKKTPPKTEEKPQCERFIEAARKIGVDETGREFERVFDKVAKVKKR